MRVNPVVRHYEDHLAPIYVWMAGGIEQALTQGRAVEVSSLGKRVHAVLFETTREFGASGDVTLEARHSGR